MSRLTVSRYLKVLLPAALGLAVVGCQAPQRPQQASSNLASADAPLASLTLDLPSFRTLNDLKKYGSPRDETEKFYLFERNNARIAIVIRTWGSGSHWNVVIVYIFDEMQQQWVARALWNPETTGVYATFNKGSGIIDVHSGKGVLIFRTNISSLVPPADKWRLW